MSLRNIFFYITGLGFLALAKGKNILQGYSSPKPFDMSEMSRCIDYDIDVVEQWLSYLKEYTQRTDTVVGKNILELGPGSDLGIGIYLLAMGGSKYNGFDVNNLMKSTPNSFYEQLFARLDTINRDTDIHFLKTQLNERLRGNPSRLNYVVSNDFNLASAFGKSTIDLVLSQATFEHFDDVDATVSELSAVCKPGAILVAEIDLKTHSRWIRDKDPNNIYRYSSCVYEAFWFRGIPNRIRPHKYKEAFERHDWTDISIIPIEKLNVGGKCYSGINKSFAHKINQMEYLSIVLCARKKGMS